MNAKEFVANFKSEYFNNLKLYRSRKEKTLVSELIKQMKLSGEQNQLMNKVISTVLKNTYYGVLLGLDGSASIGNNQTMFKIYDDEGNLISDCGEIEAEAWEAFNED